MAQLTFSREELKNACMSFDTASVDRVLASAAATDEDHARAAFKIFKRCGGAVVRQHNAKMMAARDKIVARLATYVDPFPEPAAALAAHVADAKLVENSFHDILATIDTFAISKRPAAERAWACVKFATDEMDATLLQHKEQQKTNDGFFVMKHPSVAADNGRVVSVDAVVCRQGNECQSSWMRWSNRWSSTRRVPRGPARP